MINRFTHHWAGDYFRAVIALGLRTILRISLGVQSIDTPQG